MCYTETMGKRGPTAEHTERLDLAISASLKARLFEAAKQEDKTVSQYVRELVNKGLDNG